MNPTTWSFNPTTPTTNVVEYDGDSTGSITYSDPVIAYSSSTQTYSTSSTGGREYDLADQPYDGYAAGVNPYNWKHPTAYSNSLIFPAAQQYYGGPSYVPLYGGPTNWVANAGIVNQAGQYVPTQGADANLRFYDGNVTNTTYSEATITYSSATEKYSGTSIGSGTIYDSAHFDYDGTNNGESFANWKAPTAWEPLSGGNDF